MEDAAMRTNKPSKHRSHNEQASIEGASVVLAVANHAAMGAALGLVFALIVTCTPFFGVLRLINLSDDPETTMATFVGTAALMFGVGAALTGFILMMEDAEERR
jgi:hypothetical protein